MKRLIIPLCLPLSVTASAQTYKPTPEMLEARLFNTGTPVMFKQVEEGMFIYMNGLPHDDIDTIIELTAR